MAIVKRPEGMSDGEAFSRFTKDGQPKPSDPLSTDNVGALSFKKIKPKDSDAVKARKKFFNACILPDPVGNTLLNSDPNLLKYYIKVLNRFYTGGDKSLSSEEKTKNRSESKKWLGTFINGLANEYPQYFKMTDIITIREA